MMDVRSCYWCLVNGSNTPTDARLRILNAGAILGIIIEIIAVYHLCQHAANMLIGMDLDDDDREHCDPMDVDVNADALDGTVVAEPSQVDLESGGSRSDAEEGVAPGHILLPVELEGEGGFNAQYLPMYVAPLPN